MYNLPYLKKFKVKIFFAIVILCVLWVPYNYSFEDNRRTRLKRRTRVSKHKPTLRTSSSKAPAVIPQTLKTEDPTTLGYTTLNDTQEYVDKLFKDLYRPGFKISLPHVCPINGTSRPLVIIIASAPSHFTFRAQLRSTESYIPFGRRNHVSIAFMLGISNDTYINQLVLEESSIYKDVIVNRNNDTYSNLPLKTMAILEWFQIYCSKAAYVLKVDDDLAVNVQVLLEFVRKRIHTKNAIYGILAINSAPCRSRRYKYYVSDKEFKDSRYPRYLHGLTYLMTSDVPAVLYKAALSHKFVHLEDVFFTGIVAQQMGVKRVATPKFLAVESKMGTEDDRKNAIAYYWGKVRK